VIVKAALALVFLVVAPSGFAGDRATYKKDVEFLLEQLEKKCGTFFKRKGIDWKKVEREFGGAWKAVKTDVDHYRLCERIVARVKDGHAGIIDFGFEWPKDEQQPGNKGVGLSFGIDGKDVVVKDCYGPAASAGVKSGWVVKKIDKKPALKWIEERAVHMADRKGYSTPQAALFAACTRGLADVPGTSWSFEFKSGRKSSKKTLTCGSGGGNGVPIGPIFPADDVKQLDRQSYGTFADGHIGWIHLRDIPEELPTQLDRMLGELGQIEGLVLDFRANGGGAVDHEAVFSRFLDEGEAFGGWKAHDAGAHFTGPMVVIVDAGTVSAGETVSGRLKSEKRGYMIGPSGTAGMSGKKETIELPSGLITVKVVVRSYSAGTEIEGHGIEPHEIVGFDTKQLANGIDPLIARAVELLEKGLPDKHVRYRGR